jgi:hypothetical protein
LNLHCHDSLKSCSHSAIWEISHFLWNPKIHHCVCKSPPNAPVMSQMYPIHTLPPYFLTAILTLSFHLHIGLLSGLIPSGFPIKILYAFLISPIHSIWCTHLILLYFITLIIFGEACYLWSPSLGSLLQPHVTFSLLVPNILLSTLFSNTTNLWFP